MNPSYLYIYDAYSPDPDTLSQTLRTIVPENNLQRTPKIPNDKTNDFSEGDSSFVGYQKNPRFYRLKKAKKPKKVANMFKDLKIKEPPGLKTVKFRPLREGGLQKQNESLVPFLIQKLKEKQKESRNIDQNWQVSNSYEIPRGGSQTSRPSRLQRTGSDALFSSYDEGYKNHNFKIKDKITMKLKDKSKLGSAFKARKRTPPKKSTTVESIDIQKDKILLNFQKKNIMDVVENPNSKPVSLVSEITSSESQSSLEDSKPKIDLASNQQNAQNPRKFVKKPPLDSDFFIKAHGRRKKGLRNLPGTDILDLAKIRAQVKFLLKKVDNDQIKGFEDRVVKKSPENCYFLSQLKDQVQGVELSEISKSFLLQRSQFSNCGEMDRNKKPHLEFLFKLVDVIKNQEGYAFSKPEVFESKKARMWEKMNGGSYSQRNRQQGSSSVRVDMVIETNDQCTFLTSPQIPKSVQPKNLGTVSGPSTNRPVLENSSSKTVQFAINPSEVSTDSRYLFMDLPGLLISFYQVGPALNMPKGSFEEYGSSQLKNPSEQRFLLNNEKGLKTPHGIRLRPFLSEFLDTVSKLYKLVIYTTLSKSICEKVLEQVDPGNVIFSHVFTSESCLSSNFTPSRLPVNLDKSDFKEKLQAF